MGPRKKTQEEKAQAARENGFDDDMTDVDDSIVLRRIEDYTQESYNEQMDTWHAYAKENPRADPCSQFSTLKKFAEFVGRLSKGMLEEMPTVNSIRCYMRRFTSAWERETGKCIPEQFRRSLTHYIKGPLMKKIGLSTAHRERHYLTLKKYCILVAVIWENDWYEFDHEASRVGFSAKMNFYVYSSARLGEVVESSARANTGKGLRYRDIIMLVGWGEDGKPEIRLSLTREFAKGMQDSRSRPQHPMNESTTGLPLILNPILFILGIALASCAFKHYETADQIFDLEPPQYDDHWILEWADHMQDVPVFQSATCDGPTGKIQKSSSHSRQLTSVCVRAGLPNVTIHAGRREALVKANARGYSSAETAKFGGHAPRVFQTFYMAEGSVDGQNSFLNRPLRTDFIEDMRGISLQCNPELWQSLPAKMQHELQQRPDFIALQEELANLNNNIAATDEETGRKLRAQRKALYAERQQLIKKELKERRKSQPRNHPSQGNQRDHHRSFFNRVRHMMPERDHLARTLFLPVALRSPDGRAALEDLIALYKGDSRVAYQPVLRPILGCCPSCGFKIQEIPVDKRWKHVYDCYAANLKAGCGYSMFCFQCSTWVTSETDWERHCQDHLDKFEIPLRCDPVTFRHASACAGYCPCCLRDPTLSASERMRQFPNRALWLRHVEKHLLDIDFSKPVPCPHPPCTEPFLFQLRQDLLEHLQDCHSIPISSSGRKRKFEEVGELNTEEGKSTISKRKRPRLQAKLHTAKQSACQKIKSEPWSEVPNCNFINFSAADLDNSDITINKELDTFRREWRAELRERRGELDLDEDESSTTASTGSSCKIIRYSTPASSIEGIEMHSPTNPSVCIDLTNCDFDNYSAADLHPSGSDTTTDMEINNPDLIFRRESHAEMAQAAEWLGIEYNPSVCIDLTKEIDPQLLSHPIDSTTFTGLVTSAHSLEKEGTHPLKDRSSVEDKDPDDRATILATDAKNAEALSNISTMKLMEDLPLVLNSKRTASKRGSNCLVGDSISADRSRDIPLILDNNELELNEGRGDRYGKHSNSISTSDLQISSPLLIAEATEGYHLLASVQATQQFKSAVDPVDGQWTVERLLKKKVAYRKGWGRRKVTQYFVKWQGWPDSANSWEVEEDIDEELINAYNGN